MFILASPTIERSHTRLPRTSLILRQSTLAPPQPQFSRCRRRPHTYLHIHTHTHIMTAGKRIGGALAVIAALSCYAAGQRITTIQLDGTQYYISRMNPYSAELNYFLAYEYCRSIGLQLASFETLEKTSSITDFLKNAGYHKFDYWTSGNRLGTDMLIWMSTGLPFNTTFNLMKQQSANGGLDTDEMSVKPSLPIARKKRGDSGSRDGCVALKAPTMDWVTADCTDLKDFICEQTRCYYYNYGSIPVSSSQGFGIKSRPTINSLFSSSHREEYSSSTTTPTTLSSTTTTESYEEHNNVQNTDNSLISPGSETEAIVTELPTSTTEANSQEIQTTLQYNDESETVSDNSYTTMLPTLIQLHNQQQQEDHQQDSQSEDQVQPEQQERTNAFAFESLEKAFATSVPHKIRATKDLEQSKNNDSEQLPWSWPKDILLQKPVLKKSSQEV
ncbi:uncharacterized protein LOC126905912 isoform X2 [Daktulosphaira vitifoliae]|uniref:uncharacterized protein LOC126905912 isoform X2 n=2 Tax=Daktulosphaira vitifoliae TaxID=58002 RepID=UPI0021AA427B|nr:uncharacterized protein LOC126905912 isoform X2 [Daktulosphaira vitifoliae]